LKKTNLILIILILSISLTFFGCSQDTPVASVSGQPVTEQEMQKYVDFILSQDQTGMMAEDEQQLEMIRTNILDSLIVVRLLEQYSSETGIEVSRQEIEEEYQLIISTYASEAELEEELKNRGISKDFLRNELQDQILRGKIYDLVTEDIEISQSQAMEFYQDNKETMFLEPEMVKVSHILAQYSGGGTLEPPTDQERQEAREKIEQAQQELEDGKPFEEVAMESSDDLFSGENGGDIGYIRRGEMVQEFEDAAFDLEVGELSDIVETSFGYHILLVTDRQEEYIKEFEEVKETTMVFLENEERNQAWTDFIYGLIEDAEIEYHTGLRSTLFPEEE